MFGVQINWTLMVIALMLIPIILDVLKARTSPLKRGIEGKYAEAGVYKHTSLPGIPGR